MQTLQMDILRAGLRQLIRRDFGGVTRLPEYVRNPTMPFFLWLRLLTGQRLQVLHRRHLGLSQTLRPHTRGA
jgi:hypothetical protein